jgi:TP53 regulating kinase-like protein
MLKQGAEAKVFSEEICGKDMIIKERFVKRYRHKTLDATLRKTRAIQECRSLYRAMKIGVNVPCVYHVNVEDCKIYMENLGGKSMKDYLNSGKSSVETIGEQLAKLHSNGIIHGDLTTSNMIMQDKVYFIDFGLSYVSNLAEDKAVDLYVLERAFKSSHPNLMELFETILKEYFSKVNNSKAIGDKLEEVRLRGRKQSMIG